MPDEGELHADTGSAEIGDRCPAQPNPDAPGESEFLAVGGGCSGNDADNCGGIGDESGVLVDEQTDQTDTDSDRDSGDCPAGRGDDFPPVAGPGLAGLSDRDDAADLVVEAPSKPVGKSKKTAGIRASVSVPAFAQNSVGNSLPEPVGNSHEKPVGNPVGISVGKSNFTEQKQQVSRTEWFRHELDFRQLKKGGAWVLVRRRLRWSESRYSKMSVKRFCPQLSKKMIEQISVGKFSPETIAALQDGGIQHGFISALQERIGKGNGRRRADLTDFERSLLARIESGIRASNRGGDD